MTIDKGIAEPNIGGAAEMKTLKFFNRSPIAELQG
jgi:hypothetical protein